MDIAIRKIRVSTADFGDRALLGQAKDLWSTSFGENILEELEPQLSGGECPYNRDTFYLGVENGRVVATCHLTETLALGWAGLGEVATVAECRGRGYAKRICSEALDDFDGAGGESVWLGTVNPAAASVYASLGFAYLPDTSVMQRLRQGILSRAFADKWSDLSGMRVVAGSPAFRIPMIPLITSHFGIEEMDANAGIVGTEFRPQHSCMGLFPKYADIVSRGGGWFALVNGVGVVFGLASWLPCEDGTRQISGFCHPNASAWREELMEDCKPC